MFMGTKLNSTKSTSKKVLYTSMTAVALMGVGASAGMATDIFGGNVVIADSVQNEGFTVPEYIDYTAIKDGKEIQMKVPTKGYRVAQRLSKSDVIVHIPIPQIPGYTSHIENKNVYVDEQAIEGQIQFNYFANYGAQRLVYTKINNSDNNGSGNNSGSTTPSHNNGNANNGGSSNTTTPTKPSHNNGGNSNSTTPTTPSHNNGGNTAASSNSNGSNASSSLQVSKDQAKQNINSNSSLTSQQKDNAVSQIDKATNTAGVSAVTDAVKGNNSDAVKAGDVQTGVNGGFFSAISTSVAGFFSNLSAVFHNIF